MADMVQAILNGEYKIILPEHRAARPEWYTAEGWERKRLRALHDTIRQQFDQGTSPIVYYVGAEEGEMPALCQMWGAEVVMFEPNPRVLPNVRAIWEANKLHTPLGLFVGFASDHVDMNPPHRDPLAVGFTQEWPEAAYGPVIGDHGFKELYQEADAFPQITLDHLAFFAVPEHPIVPPPTIISFDCEGSEWQVMKGAERLLKEVRPVVFASISPEFMFHQWGQYSRDFRNWLIDFGYKETILDYQHELHTAYVPQEQAK